MVKTEVEIDAFGKSGEDLYIKVPIGTVVKDAETGELIADLSKEGQCELILPGGRGGKGNSHFATSTRQAPRFAQDGEKGIEKEVILELKLLADVGLIGFPSVGKSTILSRVTSARPCTCRHTRNYRRCKRRYRTRLKIFKTYRKNKTFTTCY